ncbi:sigma 54-interacting transcriptional regulator [Pendulispora rubella]|uniref:Sigma 54-interacting transcriptional regulator n=1 Tax=Pendulispora rubella TaxID=2741070 RepID=A0ABZ2KZE9_9BACT
MKTSTAAALDERMESTGFGHSLTRVESSGLVAVDPPLIRALRVVEQVAERRQGVLVTGPTGCGKELLATEVHRRSGRRGKFVAVNCAAFNEGLAESTLFGHVRGAFTGAVSNTPGAFVEAHGGTLFLDEIGELHLFVQAKLLRALEEGSVRPIGAPRPTAVDVRIVAATNRDLRKEVAAGRFRADLYFRLATFVVEVPALRTRPGDLEALIARFHAQHDRASRLILTEEAHQLLLRYAWPGNVRELRNVMERVLSLAPPGNIDEATLLELAPELGTTPVNGESLETSTLRQALAKSERRKIRAHLESGSTQRQKLADELGIHRSTLWRKMKRFAATEVEPPSSQF